MGIFSYGQPFNPKCRYNAITASVKGSYSYADIDGHIRTVRPGFSLGYSTRINPRLSFGIDLMWVRLLGDDHISSDMRREVNTYLRNLHYRNDIKELSVFFQYDLFPSNDHYRKRPIYNFFGYLGVGVFHHNPRAKNHEGKWVDLRPLKTENKNYSPIQISVPLGFGIRYKLTLNMDLELDISYRITSTDYLDDVSGKYVHPDDLPSEESEIMSNRSASLTSSYQGEDRDYEYITYFLGQKVTTDGSYSYVESHAPGTRRGTRQGPDSYILLSFKVCYILPSDKVYCPKFRD
ncbi:MAG: DUF6089 family protein [Cytophagaceae bacterium]